MRKVDCGITIEVGNEFRVLLKDKKKTEQLKAILEKLAFFLVENQQAEEEVEVVCKFEDGSATIYEYGILVGKEFSSMSRR